MVDGNNKDKPPCRRNFMTKKFVSRHNVSYVDESLDETWTILRKRNEKAAVSQTAASALSWTHTSPGGPQIFSPTYSLITKACVAILNAGEFYLRRNT